MSRIPRLLRTMHTGGRQIPHPATPSTSPSPHGHVPHTAPQPTPTGNDINLPSTLPPPRHEPFPSSDPSSTLSTSSSSSSSSSFNRSKKFTPKGRPIPTRSRRTIPVNLPNGRPEPPHYPPPASYFESIKEQKNLEQNDQAQLPKPHPLWQFFHVPMLPRSELDEKIASPPDMGSLEQFNQIQDEIAKGRAWTAEELRVKSFEDLHRLWYVLLRERNVLATQKEERRRLGIRAEEGGEIIGIRAHRCRKSMARIKYVLNERRLGLLAATVPHLGSPPDIPTSVPGLSDPLSAVEALHNQIKVPLEVLEYVQPRRRANLSSDGLEEDQSLSHSQYPPGSEGEGGLAEQASVADQVEAVTEDGLVGKEEIESRDEGFGGGIEAKEFVDDVRIDDQGKVSSRK